MSAQKLPILADPISTFYKVGSVGGSKRLLVTTTQNTKTKTTNMSQHSPTTQPRCPLPPRQLLTWPQILVPPLPLWAHARRPVAVSHSPLSVPLFGVQTYTPSKNREKIGALALGGCRSIGRYNNQPRLGVGDRKSLQIWSGQLGMSVGMAIGETKTKWI
jgi:hypothetical protein